MKHYYYLILICFFLSINAYSQSINAPCGTDYWREKTLQDPAFFQKNEEYEQGILQVFQQKKTSSGLAENVKVLPTVIHIIHDGGIENISDAQAQQAIIWLNQALANQGVFNQGSGADCGIQLCLAQRTPDGQPTNGITRNQSPLTNMLMGSQDLQVKNINRWKPKDYVNIWLVRSICSNATNCGVVGYSFFPFTHGTNSDGIVMEAGYVTDVNKITGLAHELGHYLGLYHTFEGGCTNNNCLTQGDRICDTPPDQSIASVPCGQTVSTCSSDTQSGPFTTDQPDMSWNFMDYGIIACFHDFTPDQATRMNATVDGIRSSLLVSKGCLPPCPTPTLASFTSSATTIAPGETVNFLSSSQNASSYNWTLNGTSFGNQPNAAYTFTTTGFYTVILTAQHANTFLCDQDTASVLIQVVCDLTASFSLSNYYPELNEMTTLTNTSQNATHTEWFVNGVSQGNTLDSLIFNQVGDYEIILVTHNGLCKATSTIDIVVNPFCEEDNRLFQMEYKDPQQIGVTCKGVTVLQDGNLLFLFNRSGISNGLKGIGLVKMTPAGQHLWAKMLVDSTEKYETIGGLAATSDGGFAITFLKVAPEFKGVVAKFSSDGDLLWMYQSINGGALYNLVATPDGKITACGKVMVQNESRGLFVQLDASGNLLWSKEYVISDAVGANSIVGTPGGGFVGITSHGSLFRMSPLGEMLGVHLFNNVFLTDLLVLNNGEIVACGSNNAFTRGVFARFSQNGNLLLLKRYVTENQTAFFRKIIKDGDQGFILTTYNETVANGFVASLDSVGAVRWTRQYLSQEAGVFNALTAYKDFGLIITGDRNELGKESAWVLKTDRRARIGNCPTKSYFLTELDAEIILGGVDLTIFTAVPTNPFLPSSVSVHPWPITPDTLCTFSCIITNEICNNNLDDDDDGLFDCLDDDCNCMEDLCRPNQANVWYFGNHAGLDFADEPPKVLGDGMTSNATISSTMCDIQGNLLLYTDGVIIFNRFHQAMPKGNFLQNALSVKESIIIPHPGNANQYFVVINTLAGDIIYSRIDITLDEGRGDVVIGQRNIKIATSVFGLAVTKACSFDGFWLLSYGKVNGTPNFFYSFKIDQNGINQPTFSPSGQQEAIIWQLKFAPTGIKFASTYSFDSTSYLSVYGFDPSSSGNVSNPYFIGEYQMPYFVLGVEFSPNGRFLYASGEFPGNVQLLQFDLEAGDLNAIQNSKVSLAITPGHQIHFLQLAPNGKIYAPTDNNYSLDIIHNPNAQGLNCKYQKGGLDISGFAPSGGTFQGLCNVISSNFTVPYISFEQNTPDTICELNTPIHYQIQKVQCELDSVTWQTENLDAQIQPNAQYATIHYLHPGSGRIIVTMHTPCGTASDTLEVLVEVPLNKMLDLGPDLFVCDNSVFSFNAGSGYTRYQWSDGTVDSTTTSFLPGKYWVNVWDLCGNFQTDSITVSIAPNSVLNLGPDLPQNCPGFSANYQRPANFDTWKWVPADFLSCADCPNITMVPATNATWVVVAETFDGCVSVDTLHAIIRDTLLFNYDTSICLEQTLAFFGKNLPPDTTAQFFLPAQGNGCDSLVTVHVLGIENSSTEISTIICSNAFFNFNNILLPADTVVVFHFPSALSCDSVVTVTVNSYLPLSLTLPIDTSIHIGASVLLDAILISTGTLDFEWSPMDALSCTDCLDPLASPWSTITYSLSVTDENGCVVQESVKVQVNEECRVVVPNAFTPNGDGSNDLFRPITDPCVRTVRLWQILNRWGQTVFTQTNYSAADTALGWDGNWEGKQHPSDVLIWVAEFEYFDGRRESKKGEVTLIR